MMAAEGEDCSTFNVLGSTEEDRSMFNVLCSMFKVLGSTLLGDVGVYLRELSELRILILFDR